MVFWNKNALVWRIYLVDSAAAQLEVLMLDSVVLEFFEWRGQCINNILIIIIV
jgi:hypothetical protein